MHDSPFFDVPSSEHLAGNASAFAIPDAYPVSPGHALVISRRLIPTWWDATPEEQVDLLALVAEVKRIVHERHRPDGYNVGFNAGAAAGQTVPHLHIHVIPRYGGDTLRTVTRLIWHISLLAAKRHPRENGRDALEALAQRIAAAMPATGG